MAHGVCPYWVGYFLVNPLRKYYQNPEKILASYVTEGMTVLDIGSAMGFFSLPLARMVGQNGKVICVDLQEKMLKRLEKRAIKQGLFDRIHLHHCRENSLELAKFQNKVDFALAFAVVHEVPDQPGFFAEIYQALKSGGQLLIAEPKGHVNSDAFAKTIAVAKQNNFKSIASLKITGSHAVLMEK